MSSWSRDREGPYLSFFGIVLIAFVVLLAIAVVVPRGHATAIIYTDKADYHPEEIVTIYGSGFSPNTNITLSITRGDGSVDSCNTDGYTGSLNDSGFVRLSPCPFATDSSGSIVEYYDLDGVTGAYSIVAWDGTSFASTAFTDAVNISIQGTDSNQHITQPNEENLGQFSSTTIDKFIAIKATGLGSGSTLSWNLVYVASAENNTVLFPITTFIPASGTLTKSGDTVSVELKIATSSLASGAYHGELQASGSGVSPTPSPGLYFFKFTVDTSPPVIIPTINPAPNTIGWNKANVTVTWSASDPNSGISSSTGCGTTTLTSQTSGTPVTCAATNGVGASSSVTVTIKIDKTQPTIIGSASPAPNGNGWNNTPVTVTFTCSDSLSGIASVTSPVTLGSSGSGQTAPGTCTDNAGNTASAIISSINIDLTPPSITGSRTPNANSFGWNNGPVTASYTCTDALSGVSSISGPTTLTTEGAAQSVTGTCTDKAGNTASTTVTGISIDTTPPIVTGSRSPSPNANGWNNADVSVSFTCTDDLSGVNAGPTSPQIVSTEGSGQSRSSTCTDKAGNSASATVSEISIDKTPPAVSGSKAPAPNGSDWNNAAVSATFTCSDSLSGVFVAPTSPQIVFTEGAGQTRTGTCQDNAGNSASTTVSDINIDLTPPVITSSRSIAPNAEGWNNVLVTVSFACSDTLSGALDLSQPLTLTEGEAQSAIGHCSDAAGNVATVTESGINVDLTPPLITGTRSISPNTFGWNNSPVTISFTCSDALSGISIYSSPSVLGEGASQNVTGTCTDVAGNTASQTVVPVNIDLTPPTITGSRTPPNSYGWNNDSVDVTFSCSDELSGVDSFSASTTLTTEGAGQRVTGICTDIAGNSASTSVLDIDIDLTPPVLTSHRSVPPNSAGWNNVPVTVSFDCSDALSGVADSSSPVLLGEGASQSAAGTCTDAAGNLASVTESDVNVDLTLPTVTSSRSTGPNAYGWNNAPVTVSFDCSDALSGVSILSAPSILVEGASQSVIGVCSDVAGNSASATEANINVDLTSPTIVSSRSIGPNLNSWNNVPVTVTFTCTDTLSGASTVSPTATLGEGASQSVTGLCTDYAGNSASSTENDINIDLTQPSVSGSASPNPNANGWNNGDVTVNFTCGDSLSGVEDCSSTVVLSSEGAGQSTTGYVTDLAGNTASMTVSGINIDKTAPSVSASRTPDPNIYGWNNSPVTVEFSCSDGLSGVDSVSPLSLLGEGASQSVTGTCADKAGNVAFAAETSINVDLTNPSIVGSRSPGPNLYGWNNVPVLVSFDCSDSLSGVADNSSPMTLGEGEAQSVTGTCLDLAGNFASETLSGISIDLTPPVIQGSRSPGANSFGWNNAPVTVSFSCVDALSGVEHYTQPGVLGEGVLQSVTGTCLDYAGNSATSTVDNISIDLSPPVIDGSASPGPNSNGWNNRKVTVSFTCVDALSGVDSCSAPMVLMSEGSGQSVTGYVSDLAGNTASFTVTNISIDTTVPSILVYRTPANLFGWNNGPVIVSFSCTDPLSGVESVSSPTTLSGEGSGQSVQGSCVDLAGNTASVIIADINIDLTGPAITSSWSASPNANNWYNVPVIVTFECSDALSGVQFISPLTVLGEGGAQTAVGTCTDQADNFATVIDTGINVDLTTPIIAVSRSPAANPQGWNNVPVTVSFTCTDALSGMDFVSGPTTFGEGAGQSATGICIDKAGNSISATKSGVSVDLTSPVITSSRSTPPNGSGWNNAPVTVSFGCSDSLAGILSLTSPATFLEGASQTASGTCVDKAGNSDTISDANINIDLTLPVIAGSSSPSANGYGWNNGDVVANFTCSDGLSGVATPPLTPQVVTTEGFGQSRTASCTDKAGNTASATVGGINVDKTPPNLTGSRTPPANVFGWNNVSVTVSFACIDSLAGVSTYSSPTTLSSEGAGQSVSGSCTDKAGNTSTLSIGSGINIDKTLPQTAVSVGSPKFITGGTTHISLGTTLTLTGTDSLSGIYQTKYSIDNPASLTLYTRPFTMTSKGPHTIYYFSVDNALNTEAVRSVSVVVGATSISYVGGAQGAYSDPASLRAVLVEVSSQSPIGGKTISFALGAQSSSATTDSTGVANSIIVLNQAAGTYSVASSFAGDLSFQPSSTSASFTILKETAALAYSGDTVVSTAAKSITVSATVQDSQDGYLGDLAKSRITFRIYSSDNSQTLLLTIGPVSVVPTSVPGVGTASAQINNMQENTYLVTVSLDSGSNSYYTAPVTDPVVLTVYQPNGSFVTGGGWIVDSSGSHGNLGFVLHYNSAGNVQGHAVYIYRVGGLDYMIKSNSWIGMAIVGNHAYFQGKATLQVMDSATGVLLYSVGNYQFRVDVYDNTGTTVNNGQDTYQVTVWDNSGLVYHQAAGNLMGGQIMVHDSKS